MWAWPIQQNGNKWAELQKRGLTQEKRDAETGRIVNVPRVKEEKQRKEEGRKQLTEMAPWKLEGKSAAKGKRQIRRMGQREKFTQLVIDNENMGLRKEKCASVPDVYAHSFSLIFPQWLQAHIYEPTFLPLSVSFLTSIQPPSVLIDCGRWLHQSLWGTEKDYCIIHKSPNLCLSCA